MNWKVVQELRMRLENCTKANARLQTKVEELEAERDGYRQLYKDQSRRLTALLNSANVKP